MQQKYAISPKIIKNPLSLDGLFESEPKALV